jgi:ABC-type uncharacterized transport system auxiliary subunit
MKMPFSLDIMKISQISSRLAANIFVAFLLSCICALTGCLSRPALEKQTFAFSVPAIAATNVVASDRVLGIRNLQIAAPFEGRSLVYRTGEFSYVRDPYAEFLEPPAEELMFPLRELLRSEGGFITVVEPGGASKPDTLAEISVNQLFGDFRQPKHPAAILTIRFVFFDATNGIPGKVIFQRVYARSIPLGEPTAAALMAGWNEALTGIVAEVCSDIRHQRLESTKMISPLN